MALWKRQLFESDNKPVIRSDNGPQFVSERFDARCIEWGLEHERIPPRTPNMNAHIESFHRRLEDECLSRYEFENYAEAYEIVSDFMDFYNTRRLHSSLRYMSPVAFHEAHKNRGLTPTKDVKV
ncbi:integrase core domain-containing protein [Sulfoacidibacillus thermotolerans]